jgi:lysophospholipid acyltransferase (LPLAT)-like uncharacterized protein
MSFFENLRRKAIGVLGRLTLGLWTKSARLKVLGEEEYTKLRAQRKPVILLIWHGQILIVPYYFRHRGIMPLISPSKDGEIVAQIVSKWGYKILRGSSSHSILKAWNEMKTELMGGGELIIIPDGPRGPDRKLKLGCIKLSHETGAYLIPFTFSASKKKFLKTWDRFLIFRPFSKVVGLFGMPITIDPNLKEDELERERERVEKMMVELDAQADQHFV